MGWGGWANRHANRIHGDGERREAWWQVMQKVMGLRQLNVTKARSRMGGGLGLA